MKSKYENMFKKFLGPQKILVQWADVIVVTVIIVDTYLNHICVDLEEQVMFTSQKQALLILLLSFITFYYNYLLNVWWS